MSPLWGEVVEATWLAPRLRRIVLGGSGLDAFQPTTSTDQYVNALFLPEDADVDVPFDLDAVRAGPPDGRPRGRRYTVRAWDEAERLLTIDFVTHGDEGIAGRWASHAGPGHRLQVVGPSGGYRPDPDAGWHLMAGDESALPAIAASLDAVPEGAPVRAVLLVDGPDHQVPLTSPGRLEVIWLHRGDAEPGTDLLTPAIQDLAFPPGPVHGFVHGEAGETRSVRRHLLADRGIAREQLSISPYWRRHHTDERWREIKAAWLAEVEADVP